MRPARATINLEALRHNLQLARQRAPAAKLWAVVKANAYGHGLERLLPALGSADGLALVEIDAAVRLRERGWSGPLLLIEGFFDEKDLALFVRQRFTAVVHAQWQLQMIERTPLEAPLDVYLKVNTGMNRLGFRPDAVPAALERLRLSGKVGSLTLMTHFADADGERGVAQALSAFDAAAPAGVSLPRSAANSAALLRFPETHFDWVRPGILLYGGSPFGWDAGGGSSAQQSAEALGLQPVMTLQSAILAVQSLTPGERAGYAGLFEARRPSRIGIVALGYADGYPRHAPVGTPVLVEGKRTVSAGRVSMDMIFVDLTDLPEAGIGSRVTLWGEGLSADEVADCAGTVSYELFCALSARVPVEVVG